MESATSCFHYFRQVSFTEIMRMCHLSKVEFQEIVLPERHARLIICFHVEFRLTYAQLATLIWPPTEKAAILGYHQAVCLATSNFTNF